MPVQPITNSNGDIIINGIVTGSELWNAEMAIIILLRVEEFRRDLPIIGEPPSHWNPMMRTGENDLAASGKAPQPGGESSEEPREPLSEAPAVRMLQIAIPVHEARKLGWCLFETAQEILQEKPTDRPV